MKNKYFCIAEHMVLLSMPDDTGWQGLIPSFVPFECPSQPSRKWMCSLHVVPDKVLIDLSDATLLIDVNEVLGERFQLYEADGLYVIDLQIEPGGECFRMVVGPSFSKGYAYIGALGCQSGDALNAFLMMLFAQSAILHHTFLLHASVVMKDEKGYAFLGKSGTGKSTHSRLWLSTFKDAELLNDDNPAVRITDEGQVSIYGTPWSGKTPCYKNRKVELAAWVRLEQAPDNAFSWRQGVEAFVTLLPSCSAMRWNERLYNTLCDLLERCIRQVSIGYLQCLPNKEAALLCYNEIKKEK